MKNLQITRKMLEVRAQDFLPDGYGSPSSRQPDGCHSSH